MEFTVMPIRGLFTVVMTVFEREQLLPYAIQSLLWQTYTNLEILIYADGASPRARAIIDSVEKRTGLSGKIRYMEHLPRPGFYGNHLRAQGLADAAGEFITFLSHDTLLHPAFCQEHQAVLSLNTCISVSNTDYWRSKETPDSTYDQVLPLRHPCEVTQGQIDAHCFAYPTAALREFASFDGILDKYAADYLLFEQLRHHLSIAYRGAASQTLSAHM
jgi:glycosyltransferase involved in cell wall biosynthesis